MEEDSKPISSNISASERSPKKHFGKRVANTIRKASNKYESFWKNRRSNMKKVKSEYGRKWRALTRKQCTDNNIKK